MLSLTSVADQIRARIEQEQICMVTGHVLDPLTAVAVFDRSGELLIVVLSPQAWDQVGPGMVAAAPETIVVHGSNTFEPSMGIVKD